MQYAADAAHGALCIDRMTPGADAAPACVPEWELPGIETERFRCPDGARLWDALQVALQRLRRRCGDASIIAAGDGCAAALALAEQLPVDRLVLIEPVLRVARSFAPRRRGASAQARRLAAFARRNLALCVSDVLIVGGEREARLARALAAHCRVYSLDMRGEGGSEMQTMREKTLKHALSGFLHTGELPKPLAENAEMCIMYG